MEGETLSQGNLDRAFDALRKRQRRLILRGLRADEVDGRRDLRARGDRREDVELDHVHLPKLEELGYVRWDRETGTVSKGPAFDEIEPFLEVIDEVTV